jgi:2-oxoacid:acceptor oxidoreductase delta subunit (pyruvate/2-ketoisovalerate family)
MAGKFREAWEIIMRDNPFPAIMGRVCYHSCEKTCNRGLFDGAVNINMIEKSIGDIALDSGWILPRVTSSSGKKVCVVGGGPGGLAAAYFLAKLGHHITVYEAHANPGGMMRYGVPRYRLPSKIIDAEVKRIKDLGVKIVCNKKISHLKDIINDFDAVYISIGAQVASKSDTVIKKGSCVIDAMDLFQKLEDNPADLAHFGKKVFVYGGGNTAIDAARTALRLGAESVKIIYRRTINNMPAHETEISDALMEGIEILCLRTINTVDGDQILLDKMNYDEEFGILSKTGETEVWQVDNIIFAVGQTLDTTFFDGISDILISENGAIEVDRNMMTGATGVFAGGDIVPGKRSVTNAVGHAKKAAKGIDEYLGGASEVPIVKNAVAHFKKLNTIYFKKDKRTNILRPLNLSFEEILPSYTNDEISREASRCFSCGNCFHCDNCYGHCPDNAIRKQQNGSLTVNYDHCKGCGICAAECPCGAIRMVSEEK